ncbi:MAG: hypothetical protein NTZ48_04525 [Candidatus Omnitrophica bacterium]|nr:hypothetical protein [Candidatus Omnitrophota bacterium]
MKPHKLIITGFVYLVPLILLFSHPAQVYPVRFEESLGARRVRDKGILFGTFDFGNWVDVKGREHRIVISNTAERLKVQAKTKKGRIVLCGK